MKLFKLFLTTLLVFTLGGINPVQADENEVIIKDAEDFLEASKKNIPDQTWVITEDINFIHLHIDNYSEDENVIKIPLTNDSFIPIPAGTTIISDGDVRNITFDLPTVKLTKVFYALGNITIENVNIESPFKSEPGKYQYTQTLFAFSPESNIINLKNMDLINSKKIGYVDGQPQTNFGVALYFDSTDANVLLENVYIESGRLQFQDGSKGHVVLNHTWIMQYDFKHKDGLEDEVIYVVGDAEWTFEIVSKSWFHLGDIVHDYSYFKEIHSLIGSNFSFSHTDFYRDFIKDLTEDKTTIKISSTDLWDNKMITDVIDEILSDEKYGENKNFEYVVYPTWIEKSYDSNWNRRIELEEGKPVPVGRHLISVLIENHETGLIGYSDTVFFVESTEDEKEPITPEIEIDDASVLEQFGTAKPIVTLPEGTFTEPVTIGFSLSTIAPNNLDKAIDYINKSLNGTEVGRTFTLDINALSVNGAVVKSIGDNLIEVTVPMPESMKNTNTVHIYFINQNTFEAELLDTTLNEDGSVTFLTSHFSNFMIAEIVDAKDEPATELPDVDVEETPGGDNSTETPKPTEKPKDKDSTVPVLPETGMNTSLSLGTPLVVLGMLLIAVDQLKRYKKRINN